MPASNSEARKRHEERLLHEEAVGLGLVQPDEDFVRRWGRTEIWPSPSVPDEAMSVHDVEAELRRRRGL